MTQPQELSIAGQARQYLLCDVPVVQLMRHLDTLKTTGTELSWRLAGALKALLAQEPVSDVDMLALSGYVMYHQTERLRHHESLCATFERARNND